MSLFYHVKRATSLFLSVCDTNTVVKQRLILMRGEGNSHLHGFYTCRIVVTWGAR